MIPSVLAGLASFLRLAAVLPSCVACQQEAGPSGKYVLKDLFPGQSSFSRPVQMVQTPADPGAFYVVEQDGLVLRVTTAKTKRHEVLDLVGHVYRGHNEEGLLGLAFDPDYEKNRYIYLNYSEQVGRRGRQTVVARMTAKIVEDLPVVDPETELRLMEIEQPYGNHNGGCITFGPDRMLYIGMGDGGAANDPHGHGQNLRTLHGTILRIDVRGATAAKPYAIPPDNPFADGLIPEGIAGALEEGARKEIYAFGLRNVWGMTFDRENGDLWVGDVGQNRFEEVNRIVKGGNYGWNLMEGFHEFKLGHRSPPTKNLIDPVAEYPRNEGISVTGGYVYRGKLHPELVGRYIYGDYVTGRIWSVLEDRSEGGEKRSHDVQPLLQAPHLIAQFAEDQDGEISIVGHGGRVLRIERAKSDG